MKTPPQKQPNPVLNAIFPRIFSQSLESDAACLEAIQPEGMSTAAAINRPRTTFGASSP